MSKLLSLWGRIGNYVTGGLAVALLAASVGLYITNLKLDAERTGRMADKNAYVSMQATYTANALAEKQEVERKYREEAKQADDNYNALLGRYRASLLRYRAAQREGGETSASAGSGGTEGGDGSRFSPELPAPRYALDTVIFPPKDSIIIPMEDAEICAINTARLKVVRDWAIKLGPK